MITAETITSRLHKKADEDLSRAIGAAVNAFRDALQKANVRIYDDVVFSAETGTGSTYHKFEIRRELRMLLNAIQESAVESARETNRTLAVDAFIARVSELGTRCEELQQQIEEVRG